jgi:hypothetical protein
LGAKSLTRGALATIVALVAIAVTALIVIAAPASGGPSRLTPDLVTLAIKRDEVAMVRGTGGRSLLALTNEIGNHAGGPLEVFPGPTSANCDGDGDPVNDRDASQRVFADSNGSGAYEVGDDAVASERRFGCMRYHPAHDHWHVLDVARYELRSEATGKLVVQSRKVGFCLTDTRQAFFGTGSAPLPRYPLGSANPNGCDAGSTQGISSGWADVYVLALPGQNLDVSGLPRGHYCLTSRADPLDLIEELDEDNNVRRLRLALRPKALAARKATGPCRS